MRWGHDQDMRGSPPPLHELIPLDSAFCELFGGPFGRYDEPDCGHFQSDGGICWALAYTSSTSTHTITTAALGPILCFDSSVKVMIIVYEFVL